MHNMVKIYAIFKPAKAAPTLVIVVLGRVLVYVYEPTLQQLTQWHVYYVVLPRARQD